MLVDAYEHEGMAPPSRAEFDDLERWAWESGTKRRQCLVDKGESKRWRDHEFFPCIEGYLRDEEGPLHREMREAAANLFTHDLYQLYYTDCANDGEFDPDTSFPYSDCFVFPEED